MTIAATRTPGGAFALSDGGVRLKVNKWDTLSEGVHWFIDYTELFFSATHVFPNMELFSYGLPDNAFYAGTYALTPTGFTPYPYAYGTVGYPSGWVKIQAGVTPLGYYPGTYFTPGSRWTAYSPNSSGCESTTASPSGTITSFPYSGTLLSSKDYQGTAQLNGGPTVWRAGLSALSTYMIIKFNTNKTVYINGSAKNITGGIPYIVNSWHTETPRSIYGSSTIDYYNGPAGGIYYPGTGPDTFISVHSIYTKCDFDMVITVS